MYNEKDWRKKKIQKKENKFYANPNFGGIIKPKEKKQMSIAQINDGIKEAERQVQTYKNEWMDSVFSNASEQQISMAKNNMEAAKGDVVKLNEQLSAAYGLGKNGYWNNQNTQADNRVNDFGQQAMTQSDVASKTAGRPKAPRTNTAAKPKTNTKYDTDIALLQDELVNNPQMSDYEKGQINDKLTALNAKRDVLNWKETHPTNPTLESYETQKSYLDKEIQYAQDDMVNDVGSGEVKIGDENWNKYTSKINELVNLKDEYNNGMMGLLEGQKAQTEEPTSNDVSIGHSGSGSSLSQIDLEIAQKQDEIVNNGNTDIVENAKLKSELRELIADKDKLLDEQTIKNGMTVKEANELNIETIDAKINAIKDDYVNGNISYDEYKEDLLNYDKDKLRYQPKEIYLPEDYPIEDNWEEYIVFRDGFGNNNNINPEFLKRLAYMAKQEGLVLRIGSGYRTNSSQKKLDDNGNLAAPPGESWHEYGLAVDCKRESKFLEKLSKGYLEKYGLTRRAVVDGTWEWWHITPIDVYPNGVTVTGIDRKEWALDNAYYDGIDAGFGG